MLLPTLDDLHRAAQIVREVMPATPQYTWPLLNERAGAEIWIKHENYSPVGAFKLRGAMVYIDSIRKARPSVRGVIAATSGNFGQGVALAAAHFHLTATIVVPEKTSRQKVRALQARGAEVIAHGNDFESALQHATGLAESRGLHFVPSFHPLLIHGTGSYALEFLTGAPALDAVYIPVGVGTSICGFAAVRNALHLSTKIIGVVPAASPAYALSFAAGKAVSYPSETRLADGLASRVPVEEALDIILQHVDHIVTVTEAEIASAMRAYYEDTHNIAEGAAAAALAALLQQKDHLRGKRIGTVLTGSNVDREIFLEAIQST